MGELDAGHAVDGRPQQIGRVGWVPPQQQAVLLRVAYLLGEECECRG